MRQQCALNKPADVGVSCFLRTKQPRAVVVIPKSVDATFGANLFLDKTRPCDRSQGSV